MPASWCAARSSRPPPSTPTRPSPSPPSRTGATRRLFGLRGRLHLRPGFARTQVHLPFRIRGRPRRVSAPPTTATTPSRTDSTRSMRSSSSTTYSFPGRTCFFTGTPGRRAFIRATLHRYAAFPFVQRTLKTADMMIGAALFNARQTGLEKQPAVQEKLSTLAVWREGINAHLSAAIALAERSPGGLLMPNQSLLYTGRVHAMSNLPAMMHIARELCGGQICVTPERRLLRVAGNPAVDGEVLHDQRELGGGGPPQAPRLRPRSPELRLRGTPAHLPALRPVAALRPPRRGLSQPSTGTVRCPS